MVKLRKTVAETTWISSYVASEMSRVVLMQESLPNKTPQDSGIFSQDCTFRSIFLSFTYVKLKLHSLKQEPLHHHICDAEITYVMMRLHPFIVDNMCGCLDTDSCGHYLLYSPSTTTKNNITMANTSTSNAHSTRASARRQHQGLCPELPLC